MNSGGNEYVSSGGTASDTTVNSGGTETVYSSGVASGTISLLGTDNTLIFAKGTDQATISGIAPTDSIVISDLAYTTTNVTVNGNTVTVSNSNGTTTLTIAGALNDSFVSADKNGATELSVAAENIPLQNINGSPASWQLAGTAIDGPKSGVVGPNPGPSWSLMGTGAFYTGDTADYVWQSQGGGVALWQVKDNIYVSYAPLPNPAPSWNIVGTGKFQSDYTDVLLQSYSGAVAIWEMTGFSYVDSVMVSNPGPTWQVKGTFKSGGNTDIMLQSQDGVVAIWTMSGVQFQASVVVNSPGPSWRIEGTGDFFGDGNTDIVLQNDNGTVALWKMTNGTSFSQSIVVSDPGPTWHVVDAGNVSNNGTTEIVLQNDNGAVAVWQMSGGIITAAATVANPSSSWSPVGDNRMQFINGTTNTGTAPLAASTLMPSEFIFTTSQSGLHTIAGFNTYRDIIELSHAQFANFAAVQNAATATSGGTQIALDSSSSLLLSGVGLSSLHASNFALA